MPSGRNNGARRPKLSSTGARSTLPACLPKPGKLARGEIASQIPLTIADGYHRICASYHLDEDAPIPVPDGRPGQALEPAAPAVVPELGARGRQHHADGK